MATMSQCDNLRYQHLFSLVLFVVFVVLVLFVKCSVDRIVLPLVYPVAEPLEEPLRVTNNDGTLSNGDHLRGWPFRIYIFVYFLLMAAWWIVAFVALVRIWPAKENAELTAQPNHSRAS